MSTGGQQYKDGESLSPLHYDELRRLAAFHLESNRRGHTLQPTALAHEAWLKLSRRGPGEWESADHFLAVAAKAMRQILIDYARARRAAKRGSGADRVALTGVVVAGTNETVDALELDEALVKLETVSARQARVVELRFFVGMTIEAAAKAMGVSETTVESDWRVARAWLHRELDGKHA